MCAIANAKKYENLSSPWKIKHQASHSSLKIEQFSSIEFVIKPLKLESDTKYRKEDGQI